MLSIKAVCSFIFLLNVTKKIISTKTFCGDILVANFQPSCSNFSHVLVFICFIFVRPHIVRSYMYCVVVVFLILKSAGMPFSVASVLVNLSTLSSNIQLQLLLCMKGYLNLAPQHILGQYEGLLSKCKLLCIPC